MNYGLDFSAIREIKFLREMKHDNIVQVTKLYLLIPIVHMPRDSDLLDNVFNEL